VDLRAKFYQTLKKYGHDILLQRVSNNYDGTDPTYPKKVERHTVRYTYPALAGLYDEVGEEIAGIIHNADMIYYMQWDVNPQEGDRIYENMPGLPNDQMVYTIDMALPLRGSGGRIEYWACGVTRSSPE
jgi:hypothetical protein